MLFGGSDNDNMNFPAFSDRGKAFFPVKLSNREG